MINLSDQIGKAWKFALLLIAVTAVVAAAAAHAAGKELIVYTALENEQDLIVEGVYIPPAWRDGFRPEELAQIRCRFLVMMEDYIRHHFADIRDWASVVEKRLDDSGCTLEGVLEDNRSCLARCHRCDMLLIDGEYAVDWVPEVPLKENERS